MAEEFSAEVPRVINTVVEFERYRAWAAAQVCRGCDTPGCGPGCGQPASERRPGEMWVTEVCCWRCHFHKEPDAA
jgi:Fe-S-cluster-containing hydrogenase component 2